MTVPKKLIKVHDRFVAVSMIGGSHIRNLNDEQSDVDMKYFVLPTFDDLYDSKRYTKQKVSDDLDEDVQDVRRLEELFLKSNPAYLDLLFSPKIDTYGLYPIDEIIAMKNDIAKMNLSYLFSASMGTMNRNIKDLQNPTSDKVKKMIEQHGYNPKKAMLAVHLAKTLVKFRNNGFTDYKSAIWYEGEERDRMMSLKRGLYTFEQAKLKIDIWEQEAKALESIYKSNQLNEDTHEKIKKSLKKLVFDTMK